MTQAVGVVLNLCFAICKHCKVLHFLLPFSLHILILKKFVRESPQANDMMSLAIEDLLVNFFPAPGKSSSEERVPLDRAYPFLHKLKVLLGLPISTTIVCFCGSHLQSGIAGLCSVAARVGSLAAGRSGCALPLRFP